MTHAKIIGIKKAIVKTVKKIVFYIGQFLIIAIAVIIALRVLSGVIFAVLPDGIVEEVRYRLRLENKNRNSPEVLAASRDHYAVKMWVTQSVGSPENGPPSYFYFGVVELPRRDFPFDSAKKPVSVPGPYIRIAQLSNFITLKRIAIDERLSKAYTLAQVGALTTILIGLITTVLVALSSTEVGKKETRTAPTIRTGALIFPALGTAAAAIIAFYDPSGTLARQSQVAAGL